MVALALRRAIMPTTTLSAFVSFAALSNQEDAMNFILDQAPAISLLADVATGLGIIFFLFSYRSAKQAERRATEQATYDATDQRYLDFQHLAVEHSQLDIAEIPMAKSPALSADQRSAV
jgi:hypothetical protein